VSATVVTAAADERGWVGLSVSGYFFAEVTGYSYDEESGKGEG
jgi:hypothetical protein